MEVLSDVEAGSDIIILCCKRLPESLAAGSPEADAALAERINEEHALAWQRVHAREKSMG